MFTATPLNQEGMYHDIPTRLGSGNRHWVSRPNIKKPVIVFIGASVPKQIGERFSVRVSEDTVGVKFVNLCIPARDINEWIDPSNSVWKQAVETLKTRGVKRRDVNVVWTMQDDLRDAADTSFPDAPISLRDKLLSLVDVIRSKFPGVMQIDLASRTYNFSNVAKHAEPSCYHTGWSNRWAVEVLRKSEVFVTDRCYLWTDGTTPNHGIQTEPSHYLDDGVHFTSEGENYWGDVVFDYYQSNFDWFN